MSYGDNIEIPQPEIPLAPIGLKLWRDCIQEYSDWGPHEYRTLNLACVALGEADRITQELADELDFKKCRQLRADRNQASNEFRKQMRELSLSARPADSRPARIAGRY